MQRFYLTDLAQQPALVASKLVVCSCVVFQMDESDLSETFRFVGNVFCYFMNGDGGLTLPSGIEKAKSIHLSKSLSKSTIQRSH